MKITVKKSYFNVVYLPYLKTSTYFNIFYGGAGSGKSKFIAQKLALDLIKEKRTLLCLRENLADCVDSIHEEFKEVLFELGIEEQCKLYKQPLKIEFPNGSRILYRGCDDESKLKSIKGVTDVWLEEADSIPKDIYEQLQLRLRTPGIKIRYYISFNPVSEDSWLKKEFFDDPPKSCTVVHTTYKDNRFLPQDYIDRLLDMKERSPMKYDIYALGKWGTTGAKVYENWVVENFNIYDILAKPNVHHRVSLDFGYVHDPTACAEFAIDTDNKIIYVHDEIYKKRMLNNEIAEEIRNKGWQHIVTIADSSEQKSIAELKHQYGISRIRGAKKGKGSIIAGISNVEQYRIVVHLRCKHFKKELENYTYKKDKKTGQSKPEPIDMWNHHMDGMRYVLEEFMSKRKGRTISKALLNL